MRFLCWSVLLSLTLAGCDDGGSDAELEGDVEVAADARADEPDAEVLDAALDAEPQDAADLEPDAGEPAPTVYKLRCSGCHGPRGAGTAVGVELRHPVVGYAEWVVRNGRPPGARQSIMAAYSERDVSDDELTEIWTWLDAFPQPEDGEGLYLDYCGNCHGPTGRSGPAGHSARESAAKITQLVRGGHGGMNYGSRRGYMPAFAADTLSDAELDGIIEFLTR